MLDDVAQTLVVVGRKPKIAARSVEASRASVS
jgi:hypothetical protein